MHGFCVSKRLESCSPARVRKHDLQVKFGPLSVFIKEVLFFFFFLEFAGYLENQQMITSFFSETFKKIVPIHVSLYFNIDNSGHSGFVIFIKHTEYKA